MSREERIRKTVGNGQILILTNKLDISADWVVRELDSRRVPFIRLNTEDFPKTSASWRSGGYWRVLSSNKWSAAAKLIAETLVTKATLSSDEFGRLVQNRARSA